jgi:hypothetical protein
VPKAFCIPENPRGGRENASYDPNLPNIKTPRKATRAARIWARRTIAAAIEAAQHAEPVDTLTSYLGFHGEKFRRNDRRQRLPEQKTDNGPHRNRDDLGRHPRRGCHRVCALTLSSSLIS